MFVDASKNAYAAVLYARTEGSEDIYVQLIEAKSRIAPSKETTIPRLELLAATIGARLWDTTKSALDCEKPEVFFWSDSTTVLAWIRRDKPWNTFVRNRVKEIRELAHPERWYYVPGISNPADLPSRGCKSKQLLESRWWEGPAWLKLAREFWPSVEDKTNEEEIQSEMTKDKRQKKKASSNVIMLETTCLSTLPSEQGWYMRRVSTYIRIIRVMGWILRFISNSRKSKTTRRLDEMTTEEFTTAELVVLRLSQQESFNGIQDARLSTMDVYKGKDGLLRLKSPVANREDEYDFCHPIILYPKHSLIQKLIEYKHIQLNHAGAQIVINNLRERFWILTCRASVRSMIKNCCACKRFSVQNMDAELGNLPSERVQEANVFEIIGVDYIGPLFLKDSRKAWICLFTCAVYRAIHLELTTSLSTEAFIHVLRRFIARRGRPSIIYSDNESNFVGARNLLQKIDWNKIKQFSTARQICWRLNPPSAPWWGGWWERMVRIVKDLIRRTLKKACLSYEELNTILCDCEAIVNSRPLTYLSEDPLQPKPLTPMMFLQENRHSQVPDLDKLDTNLSNRMKYLRNLREHLRKRFRIEYLGQLSRHKIRKNHMTLQEGDIVLIGHDSLKRMEWPLARVMKIFPGRDGVARVAKLKTADGELVRPIQRLYPMEMTSTVEKRAIDTIQQSSKEDGEVPAELRTRSGRQIRTPNRFTY